MSKKSLIVVHGMGVNTEDSVNREIIDSLKLIFSRYDSLKGKDPSSEIDISIFIYDQFFEGYRSSIQNDDVIRSLKNISNDFGGITLEGLHLIDNLSERIANDNKFSTHWLDVILYRFSLISQPIQLALAKKIVAEVASKGGPNVQVLGYSLGSSVLMDTLVRLYGTEPTETKLSSVRDKIGCVHMIANVSRALQSFCKAGASIVRPGIGCCTNYIQYAHKLDPIVKVKPFIPTDNGGWVHQRVWNNNYSLIEPSAVTSSNVHSLKHYMLDPEVHLPLLRALIGFNPKVVERRKAKELFDRTTVSTKAEILQNAIERIDYSDHSVDNLLNAAKDLKDIVESFGEDF